MYTDGFCYIFVLILCIWQHSVQIINYDYFYEWGIFMLCFFLVMAVENFSAAALGYILCWFGVTNDEVCVLWEGRFG